MRENTDDLPAPLLTARNISFTCGKRYLIRDISLTLNCGEMTAIIGPNGAGKSTLLRLLSGYHTADTGQITLRNKPLQAWSADALAHIRAVMTQHTQISVPYPVKDIITLGCLSQKPHILQNVIKLTACEPLLTRRWHTLSGGEQQRVHLARALMQLGDTSHRACLLFLDEPTAALDLHHQQSLLRMLKQQTTNSPLAVCCILHDLNLASLYADRIILLHNGTIAAQGKPEVVLNTPLLTAVYKAALVTDRHPVTGKPRVFLNP